MRFSAAATVALFALASTLGVAQAADFNDNDYHEYILYNVDTAKIDVLIVPPASPYYSRDLSNIERSVQAWEDGIGALAPAWLADGLEIDFYTLGYDTPPADVLADPEIVIFSAEYNPVLLLGIGLAQPVTLCHGIDLAQENLHQHEGSPWGVLHSECKGGGYQCTVVNTNFLWLPDSQNEREMYDLNSHEFGHCLGIGHVGDALDFSAQNYPREDIMSYQHDPDQVHCVSSLNILALQAVYGALLGQPGLHQHAGTYVHMTPTAYETVNCVNPTNPSGTDVVGALPLIGHDHPQPGESLGGSGGGGGSTTVHVDAIGLAYSHYGPGGHRVATTVTVLDDQGNPASGVTVAVTVTSPEGTAYAASGTTGTDGSVELTVQQKNQGHGTWQSCVDSVGGSGFTHDATADRESCETLAVS